MRLIKWSVLVVSAIVLAGCAGGGGSAVGGTGGGTGGGDRGLPTVNLSEFGEIQVVYVTGQGRRDVGSQIVVLQNILFQNDDNDFVPSQEQGPFPDVRLQLDGFTLNARSFTKRFRPGESSKTWTQMPFEIAAMEEVIAGGQTIPLTSQIPAYVEPQPFDAIVTAFPGRQTSVQINLDDAIVRFDNQEGVVFDRQLFEEKNYDVTLNSIRGFLSDYVGFDLRNMSVNARPNLLNSFDQPVGGKADYVLFSGDGIALARGFETPDSFQLLDPIRIQNGIIRPGRQIGGQEAPGVYTLEESDPRDLTGASKLTALQGIWRDHTSVLGNLGTFVMIAFPNSTDDADQQIVLVGRSAAGAGGRIVSMWQGRMRYNDSRTSGEFTAWPIDQVDDADARNEITGTVTNLLVATDPNGEDVVRSGQFSVSGGSGLAAYNLLRTGQFVVFRR